MPISPIMSTMARAFLVAHEVVVLDDKGAGAVLVAQALEVGADALEAVVAHLAAMHLVGCAEEATNGQPRRSSRGSCWSCLRWRRRR